MSDITEPAIARVDVRMPGGVMAEDPLAVQSQPNILIGIDDGRVSLDPGIGPPAGLRRTSGSTSATHHTATGQDRTNRSGSDQ
ncbi:hypothetical protein [Nonomuraea sp. CA-141351]|uniref:hypothetical protein n=1 Tax=Nonomuraea sp. CA-141351 TaxID=3239996 RepID=UPI003D9255F9